MIAVMARSTANIAMNAANVLTATRRPSARLRKCVAGRTPEVYASTPNVNPAPSRKIRDELVSMRTSSTLHAP
jgi:hypothetical protein